MRPRVWLVLPLPQGRLRETGRVLLARQLARWQQALGDRLAGVWSDWPVGEDRPVLSISWRELPAGWDAETTALPPSQALSKILSKEGEREGWLVDLGYPAFTVARLQEIEKTLAASATGKMATCHLLSHDHPHYALQLAGDDPCFCYRPGFEGKYALHRQALPPLYGWNNAAFGWTASGEEMIPFPLPPGETTRLWGDPEIALYAHRSLK